MLSTSTLTQNYAKVHWLATDSMFMLAVKETDFEHSRPTKWLNTAADRLDKAWMCWESHVALTGSVS